MRHIAIAVTAVVALCGWTLRADAQTTQIKTEYLMTYLAPISAQRIKIDGATSIPAVYPGGWVKGPGISGKFIAPGGDWITITPAGVARLDARILIETDDGASSSATTATGSPRHDAETNEASFRIIRFRTRVMSWLLVVPAGSVGEYTAR